ncbi:MAG: hypothetical protein AAFP19_08645 [Bacteroidota bacterium]
MQISHCFIYLFCMAFFLGGSALKAQNITTNENGEKIIIYPDGSWKYVDDLPKTEETTPPQPEMIEPFPLMEEAVDTSIIPPIAEERPKANKKKKNNSKKKKDRAKKDRKPKPKKSKTPKVTYSEAEEAVARREAARQAEIAATEELRIAGELEEARLNRAILEQELESASTNVETTVEDIVRIEEMLTKAKTKEKQTKERLKAAQKRAKKLESMIDMPKVRRDKMLAKMNKENKSKTSDLADSEGKKNKSNKKDRKDKRSKDWKPSAVNVMLDPPQPACEFAFDGLDEFSGRRRRDLAAKRLFGFTNDRLRPYFKDRDYINCMGYLSSLTGGIRYLTLTFTIASDLAQREFGIIEKGSPITIRFIDGTSTRLFSNKSDQGLLDPVTKTVTYKCTYIIQSASEKMLKKKEVDKIRVVWGTGYEDYEIYELDFFSEQLQCLN